MKGTSWADRMCLLFTFVKSDYVVTQDGCYLLMKKPRRFGGGGLKAVLKESPF